MTERFNVGEKPLLSSNLAEGGSVSGELCFVVPFDGELDCFDVVVIEEPDVVTFAFDALLHTIEGHWDFEVDSLFFGLSVSLFLVEELL